MTSFFVHAKEYAFIGQEYPPYNWTNNKGEIVGLAPEVVAKVCQKLKVACTFQIIPVKRGLEMVKIGRADAFMSLMKNKEREEYAYFGAIFAKSNISFITLNGDGHVYKKMEDLKGTTIGVTTNSASAKILIDYQKEKLKTITIVEEVLVTNLIKKLYHHRYGKNGLIFLNEDVANYLIKENNYSNFAVSFVGETQKFHIGFSKKSVDKNFAIRFSSTLNELKKTDELKDIYKKYSMKVE